MNRVKKVKEQNLFDTSTLIDIIEHRGVIIAEDKMLERIIKYHKRLDLIKKTDHAYFHLSGFAIRKSLNETVKENLKKL